MDRYNISGYTRITKTEARKLWNEGEEFFIVACNLHPRHGILLNHGLNPKNDGATNFDALYNSFSYYNCDNETGRYPAFYI